MDHGWLVAAVHQLALRSRCQANLDAASGREILARHHVENELHILVPMSALVVGGGRNSTRKSGLLSDIILHNRGNTGLSSAIRSRMCGVFSRLIADRFRKFGGKQSTQAILTLAPLDPDRRLHCKLGLL